MSWIAIFPRCEAGSKAEQNSAIRVARSVGVTFTRGDEQQVIAQADDNVLPHLRTTVKGHTLVVDLHANSAGGLSLRNVRHSPTVEVTAPDVVERLPSA